MKLKKLLHILVAAFVVLNVIISIEQLLSPLGSPFPMPITIGNSNNINYLTLFSPLYPYENAQEYPWVNINPESHYYLLVSYKENVQNRNNLFLASKRVSELLTYGETISEETWNKQLQIYQKLMEDELYVIYSTEDYQEKAALYKHIFINIVQHKNDLLSKVSPNSPREKQVIGVFSSLQSHLPDLFKEDEHVYYFPTAIIKDRELGTFDITIFRDSELWSDVSFAGQPVTQEWDNNQLQLQVVVGSESDVLVIKSPHIRNSEYKFTEDDIQKLPIVSARKVADLQNASPSAKLTTSQESATLSLNNYTRKATDFLLAQKAAGWEITDTTSTEPSTQVIQLEYTVYRSATKRLLFSLTLGIGYFFYAKYHKILWRKIKKLNEFKTSLQVLYLQNIFIYSGLVITTLLLPLKAFLVVSVLLALYALTYFNQKKILLRLMLFIVLMGVLHTAQLNLFAERLAYFIIYVITGLVIIKISKLKFYESK
ncbi:MAG: hypothetical protein QG639_1103 [Patescibacteria group bacterium]|jgi:hypothetical protein|nr:hypothetical protein [Patescibacteria group bacterium]